MTGMGAFAIARGIETRGAGAILVSIFFPSQNVGGTLLIRSFCVLQGEVVEGTITGSPTASVVVVVVVAVVIAIGATDPIPALVARGLLVTEEAAATVTLDRAPVRVHVPGRAIGIAAVTAVIENHARVNVFRVRLEDR